MAFNVSRSRTKGKVSATTIENLRGQMRVYIVQSARGFDCASGGYQANLALARLLVKDGNAVKMLSVCRISSIPRHTVCGDIEYDTFEYYLKRSADRVLWSGTDSPLQRKRVDVYGHVINVLAYTQRVYRFRTQDGVQHVCLEEADHELIVPASDSITQYPLTLGRMHNWLEVGECWVGRF